MRGGASHPWGAVTSGKQLFPVRTRGSPVIREVVRVAPPRLKRVQLRFPTDSQIRSLEQVPEPGQHVSRLAGEQFVVSEVTRDGEALSSSAGDGVKVPTQVFERQEKMTTDDADAIRIAANENVLRKRNEHAKQSNAHHVWVNPPLPDWTCECGDVSCSNPIHLTIEEYEAVRAKPTRFVIAPSPEHVTAEVEHVVLREDRYWVVEKVGVGAQMSEELDPRSRE